MTEDIIQAKKDFSRFGLALFVIAAVTAVVQLILGVLWGLFLQETALGEMEIMPWLLNMGPLYLVGIPLGLQVMKKIPAEVPEKQKLSAGRFLVLLLLGMPIMYGGNFLGNILSGLLSGGNAENVLLDFVMGNPLYSFIFTVLLAPILEEYLFRKQIIDRLGKYGEKTAILFSAVTFGLFHMNLFQFFYAFGLGLIFAYIYTRTHMLRYSIIMHAIINFLGGVLAPTLLSMLDMDLMQAVEAGTATTEHLVQLLLPMLAFLGYFLTYMGCVIAGLVLLLLRWSKRVFLPASRELPLGTAGKIAYLNVGVLLFTVFCAAMIVLALL